MDPGNLVCIVVIEGAAVFRYFEVYIFTGVANCSAFHFEDCHDEAEKSIRFLLVSTPKAMRNDIKKLRCHKRSLCITAG